MSIYGKLLYIYNSCRRNGQLAKLVLETTDGQERFTFSSQKPAHGLAAGYPHSGIHWTTGNHHWVAGKTPKSAAGIPQSANRTPQSVAGTLKICRWNPQILSWNLPICS